MADGGLAAGAKAAAPLLKPAGNWVTRQYRRFRPDTSPEALNRLAATLAAAVGRREESLRDQLRGGPDKIIDAGFEDVSRFRAERQARTYALSDVGEFFRQHAPQRRLAILGEDGSGKTVLAVTLLLDQLKCRAELDEPKRATTPVPVRVNASGWDGRGEISAWLAHRIAAGYSLPVAQARALLDSGRILPVLDGLDEADPLGKPPLRASAILDALNEVPWINRGVIVACRGEVFIDLQELRGDAGLHRAATTTLQAVPPAGISAYLLRYYDERGLDREGLDPVLDQIDHRPDGPLATALRTPWLLGLAAAGLQRHQYTGADLAGCADPDAVCGLLFAALIPEAIRASSDARKWGYTEEKAATWMHNLAVHLERRSVEGAGAEIQLDQLWLMAGPRPTRIIAGFMAALAVGPVAGLVGGLVGGLTSGLAVGLAAGLALAFVIGMFYPRGMASERLAWRVPGRSRWPDALSAGLGAGLAGGLALWLGLAREGGLAAGLAGGLLVGLPVGVYSAFETTPEDRLALGQDPRLVIRHDLVAAAVNSLLSVLIMAALAVAAVWWRFSAFGLAAALTLSCALTVAGMYGVASVRYAAACLVFRRAGTFPARPVRFLEWGRETGLLRVTDIAYQFRHETYRRWLLGQPAATPVNPA